MRSDLRLEASFQLRDQKQDSVPSVNPHPKSPPLIFRLPSASSESSWPSTPASFRKRTEMCDEQTADELLPVVRAHSTPALHSQSRTHRPALLFSGEQNSRRSPPASLPSMGKVPQPLLPSAGTHRDTRRPLRRRPSMHPFCRDSRKPRQWPPPKPSAHDAYRQNQSRLLACGAAAMDRSPKRCSRSRHRKSHCAANPADAVQLPLHIERGTFQPAPVAQLLQFQE